MSTQNYRIVRYKDGSGFGLHEVYYNELGKAWSMSKNPVTFRCGKGEGAKSIRETLSLAMKDATERPVFVEPSKWAHQTIAPAEKNPRPKRSHSRAQPIPRW